MPERTGFSSSRNSFPKSGPHSVAWPRQYCGALGKVANCQVAVTAALVDCHRRATGRLLYLPENWTSDVVRALRRAFLAIRFQENGAWP